MNWLDWIAIAVVVLLELATMMVFLYQRTVRKLALRMGLDQRVLVFLYPQYMLRMYQLSFLKWPLYIYLLFVDWGVAVGIFVSSFVLSMIMPVVDWRHLLTMRKILKKLYKQHCYDRPREDFHGAVRSLLNPDPFYIENYGSILNAIDSGLSQTGHDLLKIKEYAMVEKFGTLPDDALAILLTAEYRLFCDVEQAMIHIPQIRDRLGIEPDPADDADNAEEQDKIVAEQPDLFDYLNSRS